jgi:hypothetical protein
MQNNNQDKENHSNFRSFEKRKSDAQKFMSEIMERTNEIKIQNNNNFLQSLNEEIRPSAKKCKNCFELEKRLLKMEQKNMNLMFENKKLKDTLNNNNPNLLHSCKKFKNFYLIFGNFKCN